MNKRELEEMRREYEKRSTPDLVDVLLDAEKHIEKQKRRIGALLRENEILKAKLRGTRGA